MLMTACLHQIALRVQHVRNGNSSDFRASTCEIPHACILLIPCELPFEQINHKRTKEMEKWEEVRDRGYIL